MNDLCQSVFNHATRKAAVLHSHLIAETSFVDTTEGRAKDAKLMLLLLLLSHHRIMT